jgi:hypothetical protein
VLEQQVERPVVVARVVDDPERGLGREVLLGDEVAPPQLEAVDPQLLGGLVEGDLDHVGRLRPPGAADRVRRHLVGEDARDVRLDRRALVAAAHHEGPERRDRRRQQHQVRAEVGDDLRVDGGERAVGLEAHPHRGDLVAAVVGDLHVLRAGLDPLDRVPRHLRARRHQRLLGVDLELGAEAAPDLRGDDADLLLVLPEHEREEQPQEVRHLGRGPHGQRARAVVRQHGPRLDRRARRAVVLHPPLDDVVGLGEAGLDVAAAQRPLVDLVGAQGRMDERRALLERLLRVGDHGQRSYLTNTSSARPRRRSGRRRPPRRRRRRRA